MIPNSRLTFEKENLAVPGIHSIGQYNYTQAGLNLPLHQHHNCIELSLLVKGRQPYRIGDTTYHFRGGEQFVCFHNDIHGTGAEPEEKGILYWLILDISQPRGNFLRLHPDFSAHLIHALEEITIHHFRANPESRATLDRAFRALARIKAPDECSGIYAQEYAGLARPAGETAVDPSETSLLLCEAITHITGYILQTIRAAQAGSRRLSPQIQESLHFIEQHASESLKVAQVARAVHAAEPSFKVRFRQEIGVPPAEYMVRRKIDAAKERLARPGASITEVAHALGFSSSQYFATVFRRYTRVTPSEFIAFRGGGGLIVFDGDSLMRNWQTEGQDAWKENYAPLKAVNLGVGGDLVEHALARLRHGSLAGFDPRLIVVMIGSNNFRQPAPDVAEAIRALVDEYKLRCPRAHVLLHALLPKEPSPAAPTRAWTAQVNRLLAKLVQRDSRVTFLDLNPQFIREDGDVPSDLMHRNLRWLHPTAQAYRLWAAALQPTIDRHIGSLLSQVPSS